MCKNIAVRILNLTFWRKSFIDDDSFLNSLEKRITLINVSMTISNEEYQDIERFGSERSQSLVSRVKEAVGAT